MSRRLNILSNILDDRLRSLVREKYGDAYSPYASNQSSNTYIDYGYFHGASKVTPGTGDKVAELILQEATDIFENGITMMSSSASSLLMLI